MKHWRSLALCLGALVLGACTPPPVARTEPEPTPPPPPASKPAPVTPHLANAAQLRAVQLYPDLAVKGSLFNQAFVELVKQVQETNPQALTTIEWPIIMANRVGATLGVRPVGTPTPAAKTPKPVGSLDKGAYSSGRPAQKGAPPSSIP